MDGDWVNSVSTYPSGDGVAGGNFSFGFNVLPGDIARAGIVNVQDIAVIGSSWQKTGFQLGDVNGDGVVNGQDLAQVSANWLGTLPVITSVGTQQIASLSVTAGESVADNGSMALAATVANDIASPDTGQAASLGLVAGSIAAPLSPLSATSASKRRCLDRRRLGYDRRSQVDTPDDKRITGAGRRAETRRQRAHNAGRDHRQRDEPTRRFRQRPVRSDAGYVQLRHQQLRNALGVASSLIGRGPQESYSAAPDASFVTGDLILAGELQSRFLRTSSWVGS